MGEPAATAPSVTTPGGASGRVDTPRTSSVAASTRQACAGASVRSSIVTAPPRSANRSRVTASAAPPPEARSRRSEMLNSVGPERTIRSVGAWSAASVIRT